MRMLPCAALAAALLTSACVSASDYTAACSVYPTEQQTQCAEAMASQENNRRAGQAALFFGAAVLGAAAGAASAQPYYYRPVYQPVFVRVR